MPDVSDNITLLSRELEDPTNAIWTADDLKTYFNEAYKQLILEVYNSYEVKLTGHTITGVIGQQEYDLPADFGFMLRMWRDGHYELAYDYFREKGFDSTYTGEPTKYYLQGNYENLGSETFAKVGFWPILDSTYTIDFEYLPLPATLADAHIGAIFECFHDVLRYDAGIKAMLRKGMKDKIVLWKYERRERTDKLLDMLARRNRFGGPRFINAFGGRRRLDVKRR